MMVMVIWLAALTRTEIIVGVTVMVAHVTVVTAGNRIVEGYHPEPEHPKESKDTCSEKGI